MYRIAKDLDLSPVTGKFTTQIHVGQFDLQFTFGQAHFAVQSAVNLLRNDQLIARWEQGRWPEPGFYEIMNTKVRSCRAVSDRLIVFEFENGIEMHLEDDSDQYECMQISINGKGWIV